MKHAVLLPLAAVAAMLACQGDHPTAPQAPHRISAAILDGGHGAGNSHFFWLPPVVPSPQSFTGVFNPNVAPKVTICVLSSGVCGTPFKTFTTKVCRFNPFMFLAWLNCIQTYIQVFPQAQAYAVLWNTASAPAAQYYRITASVGPLLLGYVDAQVVRSEDQAEAVDRTQFVPVVRGLPFLIDFRIEDGATCFGQTDCVEQTLSPSNTEQHVVTPGKLAAISFPGGYFSQNTTVTIAQVLEGCFTASTPTPPFDALGCYNFSTSPRVGDPLHCTALPGDPTLPADATTCLRVEVCPTLQLTDPLYHDVRLLKSDPGLPVKVLKEAPASLITNCPGVPPSNIGMGRHRVVDFANASGQSVLSALGRLVMPKSLFAATAMAHIGVGGLSCCLSNIGWGPVALTRVTLELGTTQTIGANAAAASGTIVNFSGRTLSGVSLQAFVVQGTISQSAGPTDTFFCSSEVPGSLPPGTCATSMIFAVPGGGTFVPGAATARFELHQGATLLDVFTIALTLVNSGQ
jgi:hypothetical protein